MTTAQLKPMCKGSGLKVGGKKGDLIDRLLEHEFGTTDDEADVDPTADIVGLAKEWRSGRVVSPTSGLSFGDLDALERLALGSSPRVDERGADEAYRGVLGRRPRAELRGRFPRRLRFNEDDPAIDAPSGVPTPAPPATELVGWDAPSFFTFDDGGGAGWDAIRRSSLRVRRGATAGTEVLTRTTRRRGRATSSPTNRCRRGNKRRTRPRRRRGPSA